MQISEGNKEEYLDVQGKQQSPEEARLPWVQQEAAPPVVDTRAAIWLKRNLPFSSI